MSRRWGLLSAAACIALAILAAVNPGTHELSVIDFPDLLQHILRTPAPVPASGHEALSQQGVELLNYLGFFPSKRHRLKLPECDFGPRSVVVVGQTAYIANYFSDTLTILNLTLSEPKAESIALGPKTEMSAVRRGEFYFHDATICFEGWQSCSSCHPGDARMDGLNWDLLNDGIGNPKNTRSLLLAHQTPPAMSLGVRETAETAVRAGIRHILFSKQPETVASALDEYLKSLKPVPSPYLVHGQLSANAQRGKEVFTRAGCADCHPPGVFTDLHRYDMGTGDRADKPTDKFDTPALIELWLTAPYLHDGSASTVREVLTTRNPHDQHGKTSTLSKDDLDNLCAYLLSL